MSPSFFHTVAVTTYKKNKSNRQCVWTFLVRMIGSCYCSVLKLIHKNSSLAAPAICVAVVPSQRTYCSALPLAAKFLLLCYISGIAKSRLFYSLSCPHLSWLDFCVHTGQLPPTNNLSSTSSKHVLENKVTLSSYTPMESQRLERNLPRVHN